MSIATTSNRISYAGNGVTVLFAFPYRFLANGDLVVVLRNNTTGAETPQVITTNYSVSGAGDDGGGSVTMVVAPPTGTTLVVYGEPDPTQGLDLRENDSLPAESLEESLDKLTLISQRLIDRVDRAVRLPDGFTPTFDPTLPTDLADSAGKFPIINDTGTGFAPASEWPDAGDVDAAQENAAAAQASADAALASQTAAAASEIAAEAAVNSIIWRDVVFKTFADSPLAITDADRGRFFVFDTTGGNIVVNLPAIADLTFGSPWSIGIKKQDAGANTITFNRASTDTIDGSNTKVLTVQGVGSVLVPDTDPVPDVWTSQDFGTVSDGSVITVKLADGAVTTVKIADLNVTTGKLADAAVTAPKLETTLVSTLTAIDYPVPDDLIFTGDTRDGVETVSNPDTNLIVKASVSDVVLSGSIMKRRMSILPNAAAATLTTVGLAAAPTTVGTLAANGLLVNPSVAPAITYTSGAVLGNLAGLVTAFNVLNCLWLPDLMFQVRLPTGGTNNDRYFIGCMSASIDANIMTGGFSAGAAPAVAVAGFFGQQGGGLGATLWRTITSTGTINQGEEQGGNSGSGTFDTLNQWLRIVWVSTTQINFYILENSNDNRWKLIGSHSTNIPPANTAMGFGVRGRTAAAVAIAPVIGRIEVMHN